MSSHCQTTFRKILKSWPAALLVSILIATSFKSAIADWNIVPTGSMNPTIVEGDRIFVNKLAFDLKVPYTTIHVAEWSAPRRGDIVVFYSPTDGTRLVKRVVGLPGDTLAMWNNQLIINGTPLAYEPADEERDHTAWPGQRGFTELLSDLKHPILLTPSSPSRHTFRPVHIPSGKYFMMGDNRDNSADSRYFGFVDRSQIVGRATAIVISLDINNGYRPRWPRFFTTLL